MDGSRLSSLVAVISLCALGAAGCSSDTSTRDGPSGDLNADNTFLFANSGPTELHDGLGTHRFEASTDSEEAQRYVDQGVAQVYGFQSADAYRSFRKASELDPTLAMAYWGMALALGPDVNYGIEVNRNQLAYDAIQRARSLAADATPKEQDLIAALATRHSNEPHPDFGALNEAYAAAMTEVADTYPEDVDVATLYAAALMWTNWGSSSRTRSLKPRWRTPRTPSR